MCFPIYCSVEGASLRMEDVTWIELLEESLKKRLLMRSRCRKGKKNEILKFLLDGLILSFLYDCKYVT